MTFATLKLAEFGPDVDPLMAEEAAPPKPIRSVADQIADARDEGYGRGFNDGVRTTTEALTVQDRRLDAAIVEAVSDAGITALAARSAALRSLEPLVREIADLVLAADPAGRLTKIVVDHVSGLARDDDPPDLQVLVHPEQVEALIAAVDAAGMTMPIRPDETLAPHAARVRWNGGFDALDVDTAAEALRTALDTFFSTLTEADADDRRTA